MKEDLVLELKQTMLNYVTVNNGVTQTAGTGLNNFKEIKATNLEGLTGKVALTYTFGKSGNSF